MKYICIKITPLQPCSQRVPRCINDSSGTVRLFRCFVLTQSLDRSASERIYRQSLAVGCYCIGQRRFAHQWRCNANMDRRWSRRQSSGSCALTIMSVAHSRPGKALRCCHWRENSPDPSVSTVYRSVASFLLVLQSSIYIDAESKVNPLSYILNCNMKLICII